jgi:outer membrane protein TolC
MSRARFGRSLAAGLALAALGGCASFSPDGGFGEVDAAVKQRTGQDSVWIRSDEDAKLVATRVHELLSAPLGPEQAVAIALLNNRALQAAYAEIGVSEAERVQAGRLVNPGFSFARLTRGDEVEIERKLVFNLLDLFTLPQRVEIAAQRFEQAKLGAAAQAVRVAATTRRAWFETVAAQESASYFEQAKVAAEASAELAERMARAGNSPKLTRLRDQAFYAEATAQLARARQSARAARERLTRAMGLSGDEAAFTLPERLPELPQSAREAIELEATALRERLDVRAAKYEAESLAASLGLTNATRFVNVLELGAVYNSQAGAEPQKGWELELRLPIFDSGDARQARAQHLYSQAVNRTAHAAVNARSEVREAYGAYRTAYDLAKHYRDEIVPLRKQISEEHLLRYNGMLIGVFDLIADAREAMAGVNAYLEALRDFWLAESALQTALTGGPPAAGVEIRATAVPAAAAVGH